MDFLLDLTASLSRFCRGYLSEIALGLMATLIVIFGPSLNAWIQRSLGNLNFVLRTLLFVLFCAIVYGCGIVFLSPWLATGLGYFNNYALAPALLLILFFIGVMSESRH